MRNCLFTNLKGTVDNDNLPIFNGIRIHANAGTYANNTISFLFSETASFEGLDGALIYESGSSIGTSATFYANIARTIAPQDAGGDYLIRNKYALKSFSSTVGAGLLEYSLDGFKNLQQMTAFDSRNDIIHGDLSNFANCTALTNFTMRKATYVTGSFESLPNSLITLDINGINKTFATSELSHLVNLTSIALGNLSNNISGLITDLGEMRKLTSINCGSSYIRGNIEDFIRIQRSGANGRTTCDRINMPWAGGVGRGLKFNNVEIAAKANTYIHWDNSKMYLNQDGSDVAEVPF